MNRYKLFLPQASFDIELGVFTGKTKKEAVEKWVEQDTIAQMQRPTDSTIRKVYRGSVKLD